MRRALLRVLPRVAPGLTLDEARAAVLPHLPEAVSPDGAKAGWWFKTVQLGLEATRLIVRGPSRPVRIHRG